MVIFYKRRHQDKASAVYLGVLSVADLLNCGLGISLWRGSMINIGTDTHHELAGSDVGCKVLLYAWFLGSLMSCWVVIAFSIERCLVIWWPLKMKPIMASSKPRFWSLFTLAILVQIFAITRAYYGKRMEAVLGPGRIKSCGFSDEVPVPDRPIYMMTIMVAHAALPCVFIFIVNILILLGIQRSKMALKSNKEMRCIRNLLVISSVFFFTMAPYSALRMYSLTFQLTGVKLSPSQARFNADMDIYMITLTMVNYCVNPVIYTFSLDFYKLELKRLLCLTRTVMNSTPSPRNKTIVSKTLS